MNFGRTTLQQCEALPSPPTLGCNPLFGRENFGPVSAVRRGLLMSGRVEEMVSQENCGRVVAGLL
jgi:hypothetical protein